MGNVFDNLKATAFNVVTNTMGYEALWYPDADLESEPIPAKVLFNDPAKPETVGDRSFDNDRTTIEFKEGDWPGLKNSVDRKRPELIFVKGDYYYIYQIIGEKGSARDGETYTAILEKATDL